MSSFKIGDKVEVIADTCCHGLPLGTKITLTEFYGKDNRGDMFNNDTNTSYVRPEDIKKVNNNNMNIIEKIRVASKTEPNKTLITRGLLNIDETLTDEGRTLLDFVLVQEYGDKLKKAIDAVPVEK